MEKIILITGATAGIGKATALELMRTDTTIVNAIHPGLVRTSLMGDANFFFRSLLNMVSAAPEKAARGILDVALRDRFADQTGKFFSSGKEMKADNYAHAPIFKRDSGR